MKREWPLMLIATALLLGAAAQTAVENNLDALASCLMTLGSACMGAWLVDSGRGDK